MSRIKSSGTKPEIFIRKLLHSYGYRYKLSTKVDKIKPDIVLSKYKTCIFVHGCFWHSHKKCKYNVTPKSNTKFWKDKLNKNKQRDKKIIKLLKKENWKILVIWECTIKKKIKIINEIQSFIEKKDLYKEI